MKCKALRDGLIGKDQYIRAGETFEATSCPSWAARVNPPRSNETKKDGGEQEGNA